MTLWIFKESEVGKLESISYSTNQEDQRWWHVHVALYCNRRDVDGFGSHYNAVVSKKKTGGQLYMDISSGPHSPYHHPQMNPMTLTQTLEESENTPSMYLRASFVTWSIRKSYCLYVIPEARSSCRIAYCKYVKNVFLGEGFIFLFDYVNFLLLCQFGCVLLENINYV